MVRDLASCLSEHREKNWGFPPITRGDCSCQWIAHSTVLLGGCGELVVALKALCRAPSFILCWPFPCGFVSVPAVHCLQPLIQLPSRYPCAWGSSPISLFFLRGPERLETCWLFRQSLIPESVLHTHLTLDSLWPEIDMKTFSTNSLFGLARLLALLVKQW